MSKTGIATGGSSGFGAMSARPLADAGHTVSASLRHSKDRDAHAVNVLSTQRVNRVCLTRRQSRRGPPGPSRGGCAQARCAPAPGGSHAAGRRPPSEGRPSSGRLGAADRVAVNLGRTG